MSDELKPCPTPWCKSPSAKEEWADGGSFRSRIVCPDCGVHTRWAICGHDESATRNWNTRTDLAAARIAELEAALGVARCGLFEGTDGRLTHAAAVAHMDWIDAALRTPDTEGEA